MTELRLVGLEDVGRARDLELALRRRHEGEAAADLQPGERLEREVRREVEALVAVVVELPARLLLAERAHARDAVVGQVETESEGERDAEEATGNDEPAVDALHGIDAVVASVHLEVMVGAEVADRQLEARERTSAAGL